MKVHFGLVVLNKEWKLFLILDQLGYGFSQKNVKLLIVLFIIKSLIIRNQKSLNKILKGDSFSYMEKELFWDILHKIKFASLNKINIAWLILLF